MEVNPVIWAVVLGYIACVVGIGIWTTKGKKDMKDYYVAGGGIGMIPVAFSVSASTMSGWGFVGGPGALYEYGFSPMLFIEVFATLGIAISFLFLAAPMRKMVDEHGTLTIPDILDAKLGGRLAGTMVGIAILVGVFCYMVAQYIALGLIGENILGIPFKTFMLLGVFVMILYTLGGGIAASIYTETLQTCLMMVGAVVIFIVGVKLCGGMTNAFTTLGDIPYYTAITKPAKEGGAGWLSLVSWAIVFGFGLGGLPHVNTRFYTLSKLGLMKWAALIGAVTYAIMVMAEYSGFWMRYMVITGQHAALTNPDVAGPTFVATYLGPFAGGLIVAAILAAIMSTAESFMVVASSVVARDFFQKYSKKELTPKQEITLARAAVVVMGLLPLIIAFNPPDLIIWISSAAWGMFAASVFIPLVFTLRWKKTTRNGAIAAIVVGLALSLGLFIMNQTLGTYTYLEPGAWGMLMGTIVLIAVSLIENKMKGNQMAVAEIAATTGDVEVE